MQPEIQAKLLEDFHSSYTEPRIHEADLHQILNKAILAPSGHNWQPWRFRIRPDGVELHIVREPLLEFLESEDHGRYISAGAAIENLSIAAAKLGYSITALYFPVAADPLFVAYIRFTTLKQVDYHLLALYEFLETRCTNRNSYDASRPMEQSELQILSQLAPSHVANTQLYWVNRDQPEFPQIAELFGRTEQLYFEFKEGHDELIGGIRFPKDFEKMPRDGLDVRTLAIAPLEIAMLKACRSWNVQTRFNQLGASHIANIATQQRIKSSAAIGLLINDSSDKLNAVLAGRLMERLWLAATKLGLSIQPLYGLLPVFRDSNSKNRFLTGTHLKVAEQLGSSFRSLFHCPESSVQFLFRIGHGTTPKVRSLRKPLESFILKDDKVHN